jgi:hypothetical protein
LGGHGSGFLYKVISDDGGYAIIGMMAVCRSDRKCLVGLYPWNYPWLAAPRSGRGKLRDDAQKIHETYLPAGTLYP